jgi:SAM-dependent methyltransferase
MVPSLIPARRRGVEILDGPDVDARVRVRSLSDVALANRLFGGTHAVLAELARVLDRHQEAAARASAALTLLDVGSGVGDIIEQASGMAVRRGLQLACIALDADETLARTCGDRGSLPVCGDARVLPFADHSVDIVTCSQVLHHFSDDEVPLVLRELSRVARRRVIVADLRRSWLAVAGIWAASFPLGFHPISRHDGMVSVLRGFTAAELDRAVRVATNVTPEVRRRPGFRLTASWAPTHDRRSAEESPRAPHAMAVRS